MIRVNLDTKHFRTLSESREDQPSAWSIRPQRIWAVTKVLQVDYLLYKRIYIEAVLSTCEPISRLPYSRRIIKKLSSIKIAN
jgi:hypothetical protein